MTVCLGLEVTPGTTIDFVNMGQAWALILTKKQLVSHMLRVCLPR